MKKGRYGYIFSVLATFDNLDIIEKAIFQETPTIGIRKKEIEREELKRENIDFTFSLGTVNVKKAYYNDEVINIKPEHDDIVIISKTKNISIKEVLSIFYSEFK